MCCYMLDGRHLTIKVYGPWDNFPALNKKFEQQLQYCGQYFDVMRVAKVAACSYSTYLVKTKHHVIEIDRIHKIVTVQFISQFICQQYSWFLSIGFIACHPAELSCPCIPPVSCSPSFSLQIYKRTGTAGEFVSSLTAPSRDIAPLQPWAAVAKCTYTLDLIHILAAWMFVFTLWYKISSKKLTVRL